MNCNTICGFDTKVCRFYVIDRVSGDFVPYICIDNIEEDYRNIISSFDVVIPKSKIKFLVAYPFGTQTIHELEAGVVAVGFYRRELAAKIAMLFRDDLKLQDLKLVGVVYNPEMDMYMAMIKSGT